MERLLEMLEFQRPTFSVYEEAFVDRYLRSIPGIKEDKFGNLSLDIGKDPTVLFSSHTDTVHTKGGFQLVKFNKKRGIAFTEDKRSSCLGADCTTGVWLMLEMIEAKRPGRYVFHRDEEAGGLGSKYIADKRPSVLKGIKQAIAFDRAGTSDVITHQGWNQTASKEFAISLSHKLGFGYRPSDKGMFTDTKNYRFLVPECTNISVGYERQHSKREYQDVDFALRLRDRLLEIDFRDLPAVRDPLYVPSYAPPTSYWTPFQAYIRANADHIEDLLEEMHITQDMVRNWVRSSSSISSFPSNQSSSPTKGRSPSVGSKSASTPTKQTA